MQGDHGDRVVGASVEAPCARDALVVLYPGLLVDYLNGAGGAYRFTEFVACAERFLNLSQELDNLHSGDLRPRSEFVDARNDGHNRIHIIEA
jgi:hypothetical protein